MLLVWLTAPYWLFSSTNRLLWRFFLWRVGPTAHNQRTLKWTYRFLSSTSMRSSRFLVFCTIQSTDIVVCRPMNIVFWFVYFLFHIHTQHTFTYIRFNVLFRCNSILRATDACVWDPRLCKRICAICGVRARKYTIDGHEREWAVCTNPKNKYAHTCSSNISMEVQS